MLLHGATLFCGAFLLFWLQPLVARMLLPRAGGVPAVWNAVMLFFQAALLAGYLYAHLLSRFERRRQAVIQGVLLGLSLLFLPPLLPANRIPPSSGGVAVWILVTLAVTFGLPAMAISATAPLLQGWFSHSGHPEAGDPYFLYAASNLGSLAALLAYPALIEPLAPIRLQSWGWSVGFLLLAPLTLLCGLARFRNTGDHPDALVPSRTADATSPSAGRQLRWLLMAAIPSSLLLGVTTHLTTDIAPVPLLWVVPLALYLLTFVMAFARRTIIPAGWLLVGQALAVVPLVVVFAADIPRAERAAAFLPLHLLAFFLTALVCHRRLAEERPSTDYLSRYYLIVAAGGVLGGIFNTLAAPVLFRTFLEYPLAMVAACLLRPSRKSRPGKHAWSTDLLAPVGLLGAIAAAGLLLRLDTPGRWWLLAAGGVACLALASRPVRFGLALAALLLAGRITRAPMVTTLASGRNFFGPVVVFGEAGARLLYHGRTTHGAQVIDDRSRRVPLTYYTPQGPLGDLFQALGPRLENATIGVVGLGAGAVAAYGRNGQEMVFYEINPLVVAMATEPRLFTYLIDSPASVRVRLGDGRLGLAEAPEGTYDLLIIDAFNSDAVPVHLLTREAVELYVSRLSPGGAIAFNLTNNHLDLEPVVAAAAGSLSLAAIFRSDDNRTAPDEVGPFRFPSDWLVVARSAGDLGGLAGAPGWRPARRIAGRRPWTDDHASILAAFRWP